MTTQEIVAWAAGIYDGEGTCNRSCDVQVQQKNPWILDKLQGFFGGSVNKCGNKRKLFRKDLQLKELYRWSLAGKDSREFLEMIMPYLSPKRLDQIKHSHVLDTGNEFREFSKSVGIFVMGKRPIPTEIYRLSKELELKIKQV